MNKFRIGLKTKTKRKSKIRLWKEATQRPPFVINRIQTRSGVLLRRESDCGRNVPERLACTVRGPRAIRLRVGASSWASRLLMVTTVSKECGDWFVQRTAARLRGMKHGCYAERNWNVLATGKKRSLLFCTKHGNSVRRRYKAVGRRSHRGPSGGSGYSEEKLPLAS